jgi:hypothetical protein
MKHRRTRLRVPGRSAESLPHVRTKALVDVHVVDEAVGRQLRRSTEMAADLLHQFASLCARRALAGRFVRWQLVAASASSSWDVTFRIVCCANAVGVAGSSLRPS